LQELSLTTTAISGELKFQVNEPKKPVKFIDNYTTFFRKGQIPYGFQVQNGVLVKNPKEQEIIQKILSLSTEKKSLRQICKYLQQKGIPTKNGGTWQANTVNKIIEAQRRHK